jgi:transcriptional regulator with XRE-family HTH domain
MTSHNTPTQNHPTPVTCGRRTLQRLRREAGYRSAKDFARALSIPASTYARYERHPNGPDMPIPLASAWAIADALGCSIDLVVGREDIDAPGQGTLQTFYDSLSVGSRAMLEDYMAYLDYRDRPAGRR